MDLPGSSLKAGQDLTRNCPAAGKDVRLYLTKGFLKLIPALGEEDKDSAKPEDSLLRLCPLRSDEDLSCKIECSVWPGKTLSRKRKLTMS